MPIDSEHSALGRWILKKLFKIDIDDLASEQRASLALRDAANKHKTQFDAIVAAKEAQITDLLQQIEASKADLSSAAREIGQLKQDHEAKQHTLDSLESEKAILQSKKDDLEALIGKCFSYLLDVIVVSRFKHQTKQALGDVAVLARSFVVDRNNVSAEIGDDSRNALELTRLILKLNGERIGSA